MAEIYVEGIAGQRGTLHWLKDNDAQVMIRLEDGRILLYPTALLEVQPDGSYRAVAFQTEATQSGEPGTLETGARHSAELGALVLPVIQEEMALSRQRVESGRVRVRKHVTEREVVIDEPLRREQVDVTRVAVNQVVERAPAARQEGDTLIIPILEEVVVVERRLILREELHITRHQVETHEPHTVTLRREDVTVERVDASGATHPVDTSAPAAGFDAGATVRHTPTTLPNHYDRS